MVSARATIRSASLVSVGTLAGQLIAFAGSLVLVRIFSPEEMGLFTTVVAISSFIAPLASGRLANAVPLPQAHRSAVTLAKMAITGTILVGSPIGAVLFVIHISSTLEKNFESVWFWGLPALIISLAVYSSSNQLAVRFEKYFALALRGILYPVIMTGAQILLGLAHFGSPGLILGMVVGHVVTALTLWIPMHRVAKNETDPGLRWAHLLKRYRQFPLILGPAGAVNGLAMQLPQIGITILFGLAIGGQFGVMMKILAVPITLIGQSIGFVYAGQIAKLRRDGESSVRVLFDRLSILLGGVAIVFALGVAFLAEPVFAWLLGETWRFSGELAALFILATATQLVASPLSQTLVVSERTRKQLGVDIVRALALIIAFATIYILDIGINPAVMTIGLVSAAGYFLLWWINRRAAADIRPNAPNI